MYRICLYINNWACTWFFFSSHVTGSFLVTLAEVWSCWTNQMIPTKLFIKLDPGPIRRRALQTYVIMWRFFGLFLFIPLHQTHTYLLEKNPWSGKFVEFFVQFSRFLSNLHTIDRSTVFWKICPSTTLK